VSEPAIKAADLDALVGTTLADRYRIDKLLGVGGMGAVFQARHLLLKRDVAVKVLHPKLVANADISKRFDREAQSAARLDHPNVIPVTEFGSTDDGMKYMVMQLLSGKALSEMLDGPLDPLRAMDLEIQILRGLEHAHDNGVIHRDLKPENVFVVKDHDGAELLKIFDFGIAKIVDEVEEDTSQPLTRLGLVFGTPHYMSPEQSTGSTIDHRTDIYSAGVMLYQMLAGRLPFDHDDPVSLIRMQVTLDPPPLPDTIPAPLQRVVKMMMAKTRDQRYPDARSARKALQAVQARLAADAGVAVRRSVHDTGVVDPRDIYPEGHEALTNNPAFVSSVRAGSGSVPVPRPASDSAPWDPSEISGSGSGPIGVGGVTPTIPPVNGLEGVPRRHTTDVTGVHSGVHPQQLVMAWLAAIPRKYLYAAGGFLGLLILIALIPSGDPEAPQDEQPARGEPAVGADNEPSTTGFVPSTTGSESELQPEPHTPKKSLVDDDTLIAIDLALTSKDEEKALALIRPARDKYPDDAQLLWREGKAMSMMKAKSSRVTALERYGEALDNDRTLIDNPDFYGDLNALLRVSTLRSNAIDLAVQKLGTSGHKFLLELVNVDDPTEVLGWVERHRILDVLKADPEASKLVDTRLNLARDLYQVDQSSQPCTEFIATLDRIGSASDVYFVEHIMPALTVPQVKAEAPDDAAACADVEGALVAVRELYLSKFPEEAAKAANPPKVTKKKKKR
jgi:serine/threonine protein kinase